MSNSVLRIYCSDRRVRYAIRCCLISWDLNVHFEEANDSTQIDFVLDQQRLAFDLHPFWAQGGSLEDLDFAHDAAGVPVIKAPSGKLDYFLLPYLLLTRHEEKFNFARDQFGRFQWQYSRFRQHSELVLTPVVDRVGVRLIKKMSELIGPRPIWGSDSGIVITHDVDNPLMYNPQIKSGLRRAYYDYRHGGGVKNIGQALRSAFFPTTDPFYNTFDYLEATTQKLGARSAFYFMADGENYQLNHRTIIDLVRKLQNAGHEIGIHPGHGTARTLPKLKEQVNAIRAIAGSITGGRQHYLKHAGAVTNTNWMLAGLKYDSSACFADQAGFRLGSSFPVPVFNEISQEIADFWQLPLIVMDSTLKKYMRLSPANGLNTAMALKEQAQIYCGLFVLLWHNPCVIGDEWGEWRPVFEKLVQREANQKHLLPQHAIDCISNAWRAQLV